MHRALVLVALAACAPPAPPRAPAPPADLVARSHAALAAFDRGDVATVEPLLAPSYVHFETKVLDRAGELARLAKRKDSPIQKRTWSDERVFVGAHTAMFIGKAREQNAGNDVHGGGYIYDGWYSLGWTREGGDWQLAFVGWKPAETTSDSAEWNQIFEHKVGFEHQPNRLLAATVEGVAPGAALDIATGQGRNALYLASRGWHVTGIDIADEGLRQAREAAAHANLAVDLVHADVGTFDFGHERWDLVTLIYAPSARKRIADIQGSVRHGGLFVYEYFAPDGPEDTDAFAAGELAKLFADGWTIVKDEAVEDVPDWAQDHAKLVRFVARRR